MISYKVACLLDEHASDDGDDHNKTRNLAKSVAAAAESDHISPALSVPLLRMNEPSLNGIAAVGGGGFSPSLSNSLFLALPS